MLSAAAPCIVQADVQSSSQENCISSMNKGGGTMARVRAQTYGRCYSKAASGGLQGGQTIQDCVDADSRGTIAGYADNLVDRETSDCNDDLPDFGYTGAGEIDLVTETYFNRLTRDLFGSEAGNEFASLTRLERRCQTVVAEGLAKLLDARAKEFTSCKSDRLVGGSIVSGAGIATCIDDVLTDPADRVVRAFDKLDRQVDSRCGSMTFSEVFPGNACSSVSPSGLAACVDNRVDCRACQMFAEMDDVAGSIDCDLVDDGTDNNSCVHPSEECPVAFSMISQSRGIDGADTRVNTGHYGLNHNMDIASGQRLDFEVTCSNETAPCGNCTINGLYGKQGRCRNNRTIKCDTINAADADDCGGSTCDVIFPSAENIFFSDLCMVPRMVTNPTGTINNETGYMQLNVDVATDVYLPNDGGSNECPICVGDTAGFDGARDGACQGGSRNGQACDVTGIDQTAGGMSLDCPPLPGSLLSGSKPLFKRLSLVTGTASLTAAVPCDAPNGSQLCPCAVCAGNTDLPCSTNAECGAAGPCNGAHPNGQPRKRNSCTDGVCTSIAGTGSGHCEAGPTMNGCDGFVDPEGNLLLGVCSSNSTCDGWSAICPGGDCGVCVYEDLPCFPDTIAVTGAADPTDPVLADVTCIAGGNYAPTSYNTNIDGGGLPGPESILMGVHLERIAP